MILPGASLGVLGGGQLGRMFAVAARRMGYRVVSWDPDPSSPVKDFSSVHIDAGFEDKDGTPTETQRSAAGERRCVRWLRPTLEW